MADMDVFDFEDGDEDEQLVTIVDDDGQKIDCLIVDAAEKDGVTYLLVVQADEADGDDDEEVEAIILKEVIDKGEDVCYVVVEDEAEFDQAAALFQYENDEFELSEQE